MVAEENTGKKQSATDSFAELFRAFGQAVGEVFDDPALRSKAREFADSATDSAKILASRFKDEEVQAKFREVGKAAEELGKSLTEIFKKETKSQ